MTEYLDLQLASVDQGHNLTRLAHFDASLDTQDGDKESSRQDTTRHKVSYLAGAQLGLQAAPGSQRWVRHGLQMRVAESAKDRAGAARIIRRYHYLPGWPVRPRTLCLTYLADLAGVYHATQDPERAPAAALMMVACQPAQWMFAAALGLHQCEILTLVRCWRADDLGPALAPNLAPEMLRRLVRGERSRGQLGPLRDEWIARKCRTGGMTAIPRILATYADPAVGHDGALYLASGAVACGKAKSGRRLFVWPLDEQLKQPLMGWLQAKREIGG